MEMWEFSPISQPRQLAMIDQLDLLSVSFRAEQQV